jgi:hypothetical protein
LTVLGAPVEQPNVAARQVAVLVYLKVEEKGHDGLHVVTRIIIETVK